MNDWFDMYITDRYGKPFVFHNRQSDGGPFLYKNPHILAPVLENEIIFQSREGHFRIFRGAHCNFTPQKMNFVITRNSDTLYGIPVMTEDFTILEGRNETTVVVSSTPIHTVVHYLTRDDDRFLQITYDNTVASGGYAAAKRHAGKTLTLDSLDDILRYYRNLYHLTDDEGSVKASVKQIAYVHIKNYKIESIWNCNSSTTI